MYIARVEKNYEWKEHFAESKVIFQWWPHESCHKPPPYQVWCP